MEAHHFCACPNEEVRQCIIYDSDKPNARLIGTEYIISDKLFETLPEEEKVYWHSHKYEVSSGTLQVCTSHVSACHVKRLQFPGLPSSLQPILCIIPAAQ